MHRIALAVALAAAVQTALAGCAPSWPDVRPVADARFVSHTAAVTTIDLLPLDLQIGTDGRNGQSPEQIADVFAANANAAISAQLSRRGFVVTAVLDHRGRYVAPDGVATEALTPDDLGEVMASLATFGRAQARSPGRLLAPYLPVRLGEVTHSDATLYVGGYGFAGEDPQGVTGDDVAKGILIGIFIVAVVAILIVTSKGSKGGGGSPGAGKVASGAAGASHHVASTSVGVGVGVGGGPGTGHLPFAGRIAWHSGGVRSAHSMPDAFGRVIVDTHLQLVSEPPPVVPMAGDSQVYLEMTLVDNRTGQTLWHARERFPANPSRADHVAEVFARMLVTLPRR